MEIYYMFLILYACSELHVSWLKFTDYWVLIVSLLVIVSLNEDAWDTN
jgi:hypothetical protein